MHNSINILFLAYLYNGFLIKPNEKEYLPDNFCGSANLTFYNHTPFSYLNIESDLCFGEVFLLNYVQTSSYNFEKRMTIRETWGSLRWINSEPIRLLFVIGRPKDINIQQKIEKEIEIYRDIVQADFLDTYYNLTLKHLVSLHWIDNYCSHAKFISKTDDDTFINIYLLISYLKENFSFRNKFILGQISYNEKALRQNGIKWQVSKDMYANETYPPYTKGFAYVISQSAIKSLFICSYYQKYLFIDDVFITGLVAKLTNVKLITFQRFYSYLWIYNENITMDMMENLFYVSQTVYHPKRWIELWMNVLKIEL